jgi:hypothetical protein
VHSENLDELNGQVAEVIAMLGDLGINAVREDVALEPAFWSQFPGNFKYVTARRHGLDAQLRRARQPAQLPGRPGARQPLGRRGHAVRDHRRRAVLLQLPPQRPRQLHR